jgi:hypothetical protein
MVVGFVIALLFNLCLTIPRKTAATQQILLSLLQYYSNIANKLKQNRLAFSYVKVTIA